MKKRSVFAFGVSGLAQNIVGTCLGVHLFMFYTDVVGLAPLWVSAGLTIATLWSALFDVWMGRVSDRTKWKAGRRRPYVLLGAIPYAASFALLLSPPALTGAWLGVYFIAVLLVLFTSASVVQVPILSLLPEMARGYDDRTRLAASRELCGNVGDLLGLMLPLALVILLGVERAFDAFGHAGWIGGALALAALAIAWRGTHEDRREVSKATLGQALSALRKNRAFRVLLMAGALAALGLAFVQALILYVLEHVLEAHDPAIHMAAFVVNALSAIASYPFWTWLSKRYGKPSAFRAGLILSAVAFVSVFFVGPGDYPLLFAVMVFSGAANVGFWMLLSSLSADVTDLDELESGERREGLFAGFSALVRKCSFAAAAAGVGVGLTIVGYEENAAQSAQTVLGLRLLFAIPPTLLLIAALFVFRRFPLTRAAHARVLARLAAA